MAILVLRGLALFLAAALLAIGQLAIGLVILRDNVRELRQSSESHREPGARPGEDGS